VTHLEELRQAMADEIAKTRPEIAAAIRAADTPQFKPTAVPHLRVVVR
jgi:hypothetical protein